MKHFFKKNIITIIGALLGAVAGFFYWKYVGCTNGTCYIQSNPYRMTLWATMMGAALGNLVQPLIQNKKQQNKT